MSLLWSRSKNSCRFWRDCCDRRSESDYRGRYQQTRGSRRFQRSPGPSCLPVQSKRRRGGSSIETFAGVVLLANCGVGSSRSPVPNKEAINSSAVNSKCSMRPLVLTARGTRGFLFLDPGGRPRRATAGAASVVAVAIGSSIARRIRPGGRCPAGGRSSDPDEFDGDGLNPSTGDPEDPKRTSAARIAASYDCGHARLCSSRLTNKSRVGLTLDCAFRRPVWRVSTANGFKGWRI